jgi:integrase/recombinase XerD
MRLHEGSTKPMKPELFQRVIDTVAEQSQDVLRDTAILQVSYRVGLRAREIAGLALADLLDNEGQIKSQVTLRKKTTKGSKGGTAYFTHPDLRAALTKYIVEKRSTLSTEYDNVFISKKKTPFSPSSMSRLFSNIYHKAGLEGYSSHAGRKGLARVLNEQNVSVYNIQKILRHSNVQTTINHYLSVDEDVLAKIVGNV